MAGEALLKIEGYRELQRGLRKIDADTAKAMRKAAKDAAEEVRRTAKTLVPVDSGALQRSIKASATVRGAAVLAGSGIPPYAPLIHFGAVRDRTTGRRRNIAPQPFLYEAMDRRREDVVENYARQVEQLIGSLDTGPGYERAGFDG